MIPLPATPVGAVQSCRRGRRLVFRHWPDADLIHDERPRRCARDIEGQTVRVMENLKIVLSGLKLGLEHVVCARNLHH